MSTKKNVTALQRYTVNDFVRVVHELCPPSLAYDWDNVGLQAGDPCAVVQRVLVALEADDRTIALAAKKKCEVLLTHHPLIFRPIKSLRSDDTTARRLLALHDAGIALIAAHTNFDCAGCSMNRALATALELHNVMPFEPRMPLRESAPEQANYKLVVFTPCDYREAIIDAIHRGGGAAMGNYSHVTFCGSGTGTFQPERGAHPAIGMIGKRAAVAEERIEALVPAAHLATVVDEVKRAHPYEEVAWDLYRVAVSPANAGCLVGAVNTGLGVVGALPTPRTIGDLATNVASLCGATYPPMISGDQSKAVKKIAIMCGSGSSMLGCLMARHPDVFITGEFGYHEALAALARGIAVIALGHANSERLFSDAMVKALATHPTMGKKSNIKIFKDDACADPFQPLK